MILLLSAFACSGEPLDSPEPPVPAPDIRVDTTSIAFGEVAVGAGATEVVTVANVGDEALEISDLSLRDADAGMTVGPIGTVLIEPDGSTTFTVTFAPEAVGAVGDAVKVGSNDPDEPQVNVSLSGTGSE